MILSIYRDVIYRDCTLGLLVCGQDSFFCMEHTMLCGKSPRAIRAGQYPLHVDVRGLYLKDVHDNVVRIQGGCDVNRYREPVILVGANLYENRLYDTTLAMDRLMLILARSATGHGQFQIELRDPSDMRYGEESQRGQLT